MATWVIGIPDLNNDNCYHMCKGVTNVALSMTMLITDFIDIWLASF